MLRGTHISKVLCELRKQQFIEASQLRKITDERFERIFLIATATTKYYGKYNSYDELPVLTKDIIRKNFDDLISKKYKKKLYYKGTGGSTGTPLVYYTTSNSQSFLWAGIFLSWEVCGYRVGEKVAFVAGTSLFKASLQHTVFYRLLNIDVYSTYTLNDESIEIYIEKIRVRKTVLIYGYASALDLIANYINRTKPVSFPHLKGIVSSAEILTDSNRDNIEKAFQVKVFNQYGCNEAGISAFECEHHQMHLISTRCKYEIDSGGNLLSSDLSNEGFIMLKYFTGDKIEISENGDCKCGRTFPIISKVIGRSYDIVIDTNNKILHAAFFNILFRNDRTIRQFQILFDNEAIYVYLNVDNSKQEKEYYAYLDIVKRHLKFNDYKLIINAPFLKAANAKHKYVINAAHSS